MSHKKLRDVMRIRLPRSVEELWFVFEQMLATINMSLPSEAMKHAAKVPGSDGKIFEVLYDNEQSSAVTAVWGEKFPATAVHLKIDDSESGCKMVLHPEKHVDSMYQDCLPYELGKNVYQYALACYPGASEALVDYWRRSSLITCDIVVEWIMGRAASLEPQLLIFKSAVDFLLGHHAESYIWYWFSRLRIVSDIRKNQLSGFFFLDAWGSDLMKDYLTLDYRDWERFLAEYPCSLQFALKLFLECPAQYDPTWVKRIAPEARGSAIAEKSSWGKIDYEIAIEMSEVDQNMSSDFLLKLTEVGGGGRVEMDSHDMPFSSCCLS